MQQWPYKLTITPLTEVLPAVDNAAWQSFRLSLKGISTQEKLIRLDEYRTLKLVNGELPRVEQVRIDNYLKALLRGGQLIMIGQAAVVQR